MPKVPQLGGGLPGARPDSRPLSGEVAPGMQGRAVPVPRCERVVPGLAGDSMLPAPSPATAAGGRK